MSFVIDTSAVVAIIKGESDATAFASMLALDVPKLMSSGTLMECGIVMGGKFGMEGQESLHVLLTGTNVEVVACDQHQVEIGSKAYLNFGRGSGHPAKLNFGDCFAYALARTRNLPLLFKGDDFVHTDVEPALKPA